MSFYLGTSGDDVIDGPTYFDEAGSLGQGGFNGFDGYDTLDFEALTTGWLWFEPTLTLPHPIVQNTATATFPVPGEDHDFHLFANLVSIEHIISGSGQDIIYIPVDPIHFEAGGGYDTFIFADASAYAGHGYNFADGHVFDGGAGIDTLDLRPDVLWTPGYHIDLLLGTGEKFAWPSTAIFTLASIEVVYGGVGDDILRPGWTTELLDGGDGDDTFNVNNRFLIAGATYIGGDGVDTLDFSREWGDFTVDLSLGWFEQSDTPFDLYSYLGGIEVVNAGRGDDTLIGDDGRNLLFGGRGDDEVRGNGGNDKLKGGSGEDLIVGDAGNDSLFGQKHADILRGGNGKDRLDGGKGGDILRGGGHDDRLLGRNGNDLIDGGGGDDILRGQSGADTFVFADGHGHDQLRDFDTGRAGEVIDLSGVAGFSVFADVLAAATDQTQGVAIETGADSSILLKGLTVADLATDDFLFA